MKRLPIAAALTFALVLFGACSGGGGGSSKSESRACNPGAGSTFCLTSCNLGCSQLGCSVTDIAQNQPIVLCFSQDVDPASVNSATISLKTTAGQSPTGRFEVDGKCVVFVPDIRVQGGVTSFGFAAGATYLLTLPSSAGSDTLRSVSGDPLQVTLTCSLRVSRGIVDLDGSCPKATLITPAATENVPADTVIVVEFSEFIDTAPFRGATTETSPISYLIRKTRINPKTNKRECDPNFDPIVLEGLPKAELNPAKGTSVVTLKPSVPLPSQICVEVGVTSRVKDLAGTPACPVTFTFTTRIVSSGVGEIKETFGNDGQLDKKVSSGIWSNGVALPPQIGGTGVLGSFAASSGTAYFNVATQKTIFVWSTDKQVIPAALTLSGKEETVTDGVFNFTDFFLPNGSHVVFEGSNPPVINVRGMCQVDGRIDLGVAIRNAKGDILRLVTEPDVPGGKPNSQTNPFGYDAEGTTGQVAQPGGPGGGKGGKGGEPCLNNGPNASFNGGNGEDVQLKAGHSYASKAALTGGRGTLLYPASGRITAAGGDYDVLSTYSAYTAAGGGGGGHHAVGTVSKVFAVPPLGGNQKRKPNDSIRMGPASPGGIAFDVTGAAPSGTSLDHYLVGGSGGGGGCSHSLLTTANSARWLGGASGAGGGGAIAFRVGQDFGMKTSGEINAKGGSGFKYGLDTAELFNVPCAGAGGAGGSVVLQVFNDVSMGGKLDTSGGQGGLIDNTGTQVKDVFGVKAVAGNGASGYVRLETRAGAKAFQLGTTIPIATTKNVGTLTDSDTKTSSQSLFYTTRLTFPPTFERYELEVFLDGVRKLYSDDPDVGKPTIGGKTNPIFDKDYAGRADSAQPVYFQIQGAKVSTVSGLPDLSTLGPWREFVKGTTNSLNKDLPTGFRFQLAFDLSATKKIEVRRMSVFFTE